MSESTEVKKSKRELVLDALNEGGATMKSLMAAADCKYESIMSIFSTLRLMGHCPVKDVPSEDNPEEMTFRVVSAEEWAEIKAERAANAKSKSTAKPRSPAEVLEAATKKVARCTKANDNAIKRANADESSQLLEWKAGITRLQLLVAEDEKAAAQIAFDNSDEAEEAAE